MSAADAAGPHTTLPIATGDAGPITTHDAPGPVAADEPGPVRLILTLGVAGLISGLCLVGVFLATESRIEQNRADALEAAVYQVLPGAAAFQAFVLKDDTVVLHDGADGLPEGEAVYAAYDASGAPLGFAIPGSGPGFQDTLGILVGWDPARRRVVGMAVLETRETPGLGDKIITDTAFTSSFQSLALDPPAVLVAPGARSADHEVDGISGATISAQAIVRIVNQSVAAWEAHLPTLGPLEVPGGQAAADTEPAP